MAMVDPPALPPVEVAALDQPIDVLEWNALNYLQMLSDLVY